MRTKRKKVKHTKWSLSREALATEIEQASTLLQLCCNWAFSLSEGVADFQNDMLAVTSGLEKLKVRSLSRDMDLAQQRKIRGVLWQLRKYSREMADETKPLSVINMVSDCESIAALLQMIREVLQQTKRDKRLGRVVK
jgi:hypothetical protein